MSGKFLNFVEYIFEWLSNNISHTQHTAVNIFISYYLEIYKNREKKPLLTYNSILTKIANPLQIPTSVVKPLHTEKSNIYPYIP